MTHDEGQRIHRKLFSLLGIFFSHVLHVLWFWCRFSLWKVTSWILIIVCIFSRDVECNIIRALCLFSRAESSHPNLCGRPSRTNLYPMALDAALWVSNPPGQNLVHLSFILDHHVCDR